jgi:hypothetical protein
VSKLACALRKACLAPACLRQAVKVNFDISVVLADKRYRLMQLSQRCVTSVIKKKSYNIFDHTAMYYLRDDVGLGATGSHDLQVIC